MIDMCNAKTNKVFDIDFNSHIKGNAIIKASSQYDVEGFISIKDMNLQENRTIAQARISKSNISCRCQANEDKTISFETLIEHLSENAGVSTRVIEQLQDCVRMMQNEVTKRSKELSKVASEHDR